MTCTKRVNECDDYVETLIDIIRYRRDELGLTQQTIATRCNMSMTGYAMIERRERSPSVETLFRILRALNMSIAIHREEDGIDMSGALRIR